jgi:hypothetical protein
LQREAPGIVPVCFSSGSWLAVEPEEMVSSMVKLPASDLRFEDAVEAVGIGMVSIISCPFL